MFKFRLANSKDGLDNARASERLLSHFRETFNTLPTALRRSAFVDEQNIDTLTLGLDCEEGLSVDELDLDKVDELRAVNRHVCEITKLAVDQSVRSKRVLATLFHLCYIMGRNIHGATDFLIEVNPRHVSFYKRMLGFEQFGDEKICPRVDAPAILLRLELDHAERMITEFWWPNGSSDWRTIPVSIFSSPRRMNSVLPDGWRGEISLRHS